MNLWFDHKGRNLFPKTSPLAVVSTLAIYPVRCSVLEYSPNLCDWHLRARVWPFQDSLEESHLGLIQSHREGTYIQIVFWDKRKNVILKGFVNVVEIIESESCDFMDITMDCDGRMTVVEDLDTLSNPLINVKSNNINARLLASGVVWENIKHKRRDLNGLL